MNVQLRYSFFLRKKKKNPRATDDLQVDMEDSLPNNVSHQRLQV